VQRISYERPGTLEAAVQAGAAEGAAFYAGGTTLIDLMKLDVMTPSTLVDINRLALAGVDVSPLKLRFGALARMSDAAGDPRVRQAAPAIAEALEQSASAQLRNMASLGGNVLQRTRCAYFRDAATPCNKREPGSGCGARAGVNDEMAILGTSEHCIAFHASDFAVPLVAFDAVFRVQSATAKRVIPSAVFFLQPGDTPEHETTLAPGELIVEIELDRTVAAAHSTYVKVRDRTSYAFALASCAAGVELARDGSIADVRLALGGVGTVPWRAQKSEAALRGKRPGREAFVAAARAEFVEARPTLQNAYKIDLGIAAMVRALETVTA
jgi:xanthine dehydrogenase YagS FAD-binding subunit